MNLDKIMDEFFSKDNIDLENMIGAMEDFLTIKIKELFLDNADEYFDEEEIEELDKALDYFCNEKIKTYKTYEEIHNEIINCFDSKKLNIVLTVDDWRLVLYMLESLIITKDVYGENVKEKDYRRAKKLKAKIFSKVFGLFKNTQEINDVVNDPEFDYSFKVKTPLKLKWKTVGLIYSLINVTVDGFREKSKELEDTGFNWSELINFCKEIEILTSYVSLLERLNETVDDNRYRLVSEFMIDTYRNR